MIILIIVVVVVLSFLIQILLISDLSLKIATFWVVSKNCIRHQVSLLRQEVLHNILVLQGRTFRSCNLHLFFLGPYPPAL